MSTRPTDQETSSHASKLEERGSLDRQVERNPPNNVRLLQTRAAKLLLVLSAHTLAFGLHRSKHG